MAAEQPIVLMLSWVPGASSIQAPWGRALAPCSLLYTPSSLPATLPLLLPTQVLELEPGNSVADKAAKRLLPVVEERREKLKEEMFGEGGWENAQPCPVFLAPRYGSRGPRIVCLRTGSRAAGQGPELQACSLLLSPWPPSTTSPAA